MVVMAHGVNAELKRSGKGGGGDAKTGIGSRRIFPPHFKLQVLDSYRKDADCKGNQRATARKYGIHRRQIQKWLQAEGNLRNSVVMVSAKAATGLGGAASAAAAAAAAAVIVGGGCGGAESEARKCGHVEMSLSRRQRDDSPLESYPQQTTASRVPALSPSSSSYSSSYHEIPMTTTTTTTTTTTIIMSGDHWQPLDFSTQSREAPIDLSLKRPTPSPSPPSASPPPIYAPTATSLPPQHPDIWDLSTKPKPTKLFKPYDLDDFHNNNNNNNSSSNNYNYNDTYTLHELRPHIYQCYQTSSTYPHIYYEDQTHILKQRHSYSLDFKLNAIESYYQDDSCKGNQRAVASKFNIHRRQVQKWLKQEDELRQRNDHAHTVR